MKKDPAEGAAQGEPNIIETGALPPPPPKPKSLFAELPKGWNKPVEVLDRVTVVRTIFHGFNRATKVGGLPTKRITTLSGPTHGGKTVFEIGLLKSFTDGGHAAGLIDAEYATQRELPETFFGCPLEDVPNLVAKRPESYEETVDSVEAFLNHVIKLRKEVKPDLASIMVIDSITRLVPKKELARLMKEGGEALDKGLGRYRAAMNEAWLANLLSKIHKANCALVLIAQERDAPDDTWENGEVQETQIKGGKALRFDASLVGRIMKSSANREGKEGAIMGYAHKLRIWKLRTGSMEGRYTDCTFNISNGNVKGIPAGFDTARDALQVGQDMGLVTLAGSYYCWRKQRWNGEKRALLDLYKQPELLRALHEDVARAIDVECKRETV